MMQRPNTTKSDLKQPLLPRENADMMSAQKQHTNGNNFASGLLEKIIAAVTGRRAKSKRYEGSSVSGCPKTIAILLGSSLFWEFARDPDTVYLLPGEWIVLSISLLVLLQATLLSDSSTKANRIWDLYALFLLCQTFIQFISPLWVTYYLFAAAFLAQTISLGIQAAIFLRSEEALHGRTFDKEDLVPITKTHWGFVCNECNTSPIVGIRYHRAKDNSSYDVCESCMAEKQSAEIMEHLVAIEKPLPLSHNMLGLLRAKEAHYLNQRKIQKEWDDQEALLHASVDPKQASTLDIV
jgi:hypothetical protein